MSRGEAIVVTYDSTADQEDILWGLGLGCNGIVQVLIEFLLPDACNSLTVLDECWRDRTPAVLASIPQSEGLIAQTSISQKRSRRFWEITTDLSTIPENSTCYVMTEIPELKYKDVGNLYGCRNWVEYGLNQSKNELGWADFRLTQYQDIEKWADYLFSSA